MTKLVDTQPRNASTDAESGFRFYRWQDQKLISVTTARRAAGMPFGLHNWAIGQVINGVFENIETIAARLLEQKSVNIGNRIEGDLAVLKHEVRAFATAERDAAAALGTAVHDAASRNLDPATVDPLIRPRLIQFLDWLRVSKATVLASEFQIYNLSQGYGGTVDLLVQMPNDTIWLVDLKTGKGVYAEHALQVVPYARAEFSGRHMCSDKACKDPTHDVVDDGLTELLGLIDGTAILHLADDGWEFRVIPNDDETFEAFLGLLKFAQFTMDHPTAESITSAMKAGHAPVEVPGQGRLDDSEAPASEAEMEVFAAEAQAEIEAEAASDPTPAPVEPQRPAFAAVEAADVVEEAKRIFAGEIATIDGVPQPMTREQFLEAVRFVEMPSNLLMATARQLFPEVPDMRSLTDAQRGTLFAAADTAWAGTA